MKLRRAPGRPAMSDLRYLRREGNRKVRARRRRRHAARWLGVGLAAVAGLTLSVAAAGCGVRWATGPRRFPLKNVVVREAREAATEEVRALVHAWMGMNILTIPLTEVEREVRRHPWVGSGGGVRIERRLPSSLVITLRERMAGGLALLDGVAWLLDDKGMPIDRFGPRYAHHDFPLLKGIEPLRGPEDRDRLARALSDGVAVSRALREGEPAFWEAVSEIDVSHEHQIVLREEGSDHAIRLSADAPLRNLRGYLELRDEMGGNGEIEYVDLRWRDRIAVMPAAQQPGSGGK